MSLDEMVVALGDVCSAYPALEPPNRMSVCEGVASVLKIKRPGGGNGPWSPAETPYMVKPGNTLASRRHSAVCFVGPAQTGKTVLLIDGWMAHCVVNDPGDMMVVQMTQDKAREYSKQRIDRAIKNSPKLEAMRSSLARDDNLHDKQFRNGMWVKFAWPTATNFASTSYRYVAGTDYDRWPDDIDGEGDGFTLMGKRTTTFLSRGMVAVESSPSRPITDPTWRPATPHEAPPVGGILGIYNRSDRQRLYWPCPHCRSYFEATPGLGRFHLPSDDELIEGIREIDIDKFARQYARVICPNGCVIRPAERETMNRLAVWLEEGLTIDENGRVSGNPRTSSIAGFWLGGLAATYVSWEGLIRKHAQALLDYALTGSELPLMTTANTDQGVPYMSRLLAAARDGQGVKRYDADLKRYIVPAWARFLVATVDIQGGKGARFVVQVMAIGVHQEQQLVDRYNITMSQREGFGDEKAPLDPGQYPEDWDILTDKVLPATYRIDGMEDRELRLRLLVVDTGGEGGVTDNAYAWYRRLRKAGKHQRVRVTKGASGRPEWHIKETMVGGKQGSGDIPLQLLNPNLFKDIVDANLKRPSPGPGYYHFPEPRHPIKNPDGWLPQTFFDELAAEVRNENGVWEQIKKRNESFDLCYMTRAGCMMLGADKRNFWDNPPGWAKPLPENSDVVVSEIRRAEQATAQQARATAPPSTLERRVTRSSYLA